ncbi:MAG: hypothetical protein ACKVRN_15300 [Pyrinomonadaceae bacterium]
MKLLILVFVLLAGFLPAQEQSRATLVDEFGIVTCEDLLARTDNFRLMLSNNPVATGLVIISRGKERPRRADWYRTLVYNTLRRNDFDTSRLVIYRGEDGAGTNASFWVVPPGVRLPASAHELWSSANIINLSKPIMIGSEDDTGVCPTFVPKDFADLIKENPEVIGKIVVHQESSWDPAIIGLPWIDTLVKKYGVPRQRLKLIYGKASKTIGYTEFWLIPVKK